MPNKGHVHKSRLVVNSHQDKATVEKLMGLSPLQCRKNFQIGVALAATRDHRLYAQVVTDKCEPNLDNQHQTYPNIAQQKIRSIEGQSSNKTTNVVGKHVQSTCSTGKNH